MKPILTQARKFSMFILAIAFLGCTDVEDILPSVTSAFTYTINEDTGTVTFINLSEGANKYAWDFGDGTTSSEINPIKAYTATGTYTVSLVATNVSGASDTSEDVISILIKQGISLPITFDDANVAYEATTFSGASFEIVENPDVSGSNDKASRVGAITNSGNAFEGIFFDLQTPVDLTARKTITMNVWAEAPVPVLLKLEEGTSAAIEFVANHGGTGWEEIAFDFDSEASYSRLTLFVDGPGTTAGTFYVDDIVQLETDNGGNTGGSIEACEGGELVNDFESADDSIFNNFGGGVGTIIDNPDTSVNTSAKLGQYVKNAGEVFAGITIEVDPDIAFNAGVFSIDVNS
ncbi:PKD domain-containing protein, partial [Robiginitalea marina]